MCLLQSKCLPFNVQVSQLGGDASAEDENDGADAAPPRTPDTVGPQQRDPLRPQQQQQQQPPPPPPRSSRTVANIAHSFMVRSAGLTAVGHQQSVLQLSRVLVRFSIHHRQAA